jgi:hypothetical protein
MARMFWPSTDVLLSIAANATTPVARNNLWLIIIKFSGLYYYKASIKTRLFPGLLFFQPMEKQLYRDSEVHRSNGKYWV